MAVSYSGSRVTVGTYKSGTTLSNSTTTLNITSGQIVSGDIGRLVAVRPSLSTSAETQVRKITGVSGGTISIHDPWVGTIPSGATWIVAHTLEDVHAIGNAGLQKTGLRTYRWQGDWNVTGFLGDLNASLETSSSGQPGWPVGSGAIVQFGILWGGEGTGTQTTEGCRIYFTTASSNNSLYSNTNSRDPNGGVINYYNCVVHSTSTRDWMFQRMRGPTRFIGCTFDGVVGGRFYHENSEWVQCRMSGNNNAIPAWSIGATFNRNIDTIFSYRNLMAMKSYLGFGGTLRNVTFADNTNIFSREGSSGSTFQFIDCTEFGAGQTTNNGGIIHQDRSVNIITTDDSGTALADISIRINNSLDQTQGMVYASDGSGAIPEIFARRFTVTNNSSTFTNFAPFRMRLRGFGYFWVSLNSSIEDPIRQSFAMAEDPSVTQSSAASQAHTGITVTDHGGSPVAWNGKSWGITVTGNLSINPSLTLEDIKHYLHWHLSRSTSFEGKTSGLNWHNLIPMSGNDTENGNYGGTIKGVRVIDDSGNSFPDVVRMQADDGTFYVPPVQYSVTLTGLKANSEVRIYQSGTNTELAGVENSGTAFTYNYEYTTDFDVDYVIFSLGFLPVRATGLTLSNTNNTIPVQQFIDRVYNNP